MFTTVESSGSAAGKPPQNFNNSRGSATIFFPNAWPNQVEQGNPRTIPKILKINRTRNPTGGLPVHYVG